MAPKNSKTPVFSYSALKQAFSELYGGGAEEPENPARRQLLKQSGAAVISSILPETSIPKVEHNIMENAGDPHFADELNAAVDSYMHRFVLDEDYVESTYKDSGGRGITSKYSDLLWRLLDPTYRDFAINPSQDALVPIARTSQEAIKWVEYLFAKHTKERPKFYVVNRFLIAHPDKIELLADAIQKNGKYKTNRYVKDALTHLQQQLDYFPTVSSIENSLQSNLENSHEASNAMLYRRFGVMLPDTTSKERIKIKAETKDELKENGLSDDIWSPEIARKYSEDDDNAGHHQPTYLLNLDYDNDNTPEETSKEFHTLIAAIISLYPARLHTSDDMELAQAANMPGIVYDSSREVTEDNNLTLLLTPTRMGLLITFPAGYENTQLEQMKEYLDEKARAQSLPQKAELER